MSEHLIVQLEAGFENLVAALDGQDADSIIEAAAALRPMVLEIESQGVWRQQDAVKGRLDLLSKHIDAARYRVNKLTNLNEQRAINLAQAMGAPMAPLYKDSRKPG